VNYNNNVGAVVKEVKLSGWWEMKMHPCQIFVLLCFMRDIKRKSKIGEGDVV
jgi:hypothetical protein